MYILVGLGNPGLEYRDTRHNIGFMTIDMLGDKFGMLLSRRAHRALIGETRVKGERVVLAKPQTYMNLSGESVRDIMNWYKADHDSLVVIYDDIDLPLGSIRIRERGSSGTHNGMKSIIYQLGYDDFPRIRVGIGASAGRQLASYVLGVPDESEREPLIAAMRMAADAAAMIVEGRIKDAQALYNKKGKTLSKESEQPSDR